MSKNTVKISDKTDFCYEFGITNYMSEYAEGLDSMMFGQLSFLSISSKITNSD